MFNAGPVAVKPGRRREPGLADHIWTMVEIVALLP
jgi:hypothetical protein